MAKWYYSVGDRAQGPVDEAVILETIANGQLTLVDLVYREGDKAWKTIGEIPEFKAAFTKQAEPEPLNEVKPVEVEPSLPPEVESDGPFRFESGVQLTWVLLQKTKGTAGDKFVQSGPYSAEQLESMLLGGLCKYADYVWRPGYKRWTRLGNLPEFDRRRKNRDGDETPELVPLPEIDTSLPAEARDLLSSVVQAVPPSLSSLTVPNEFRPEEAAGNDLTEDTASQFDLRTMEKPQVSPGPKEIHLRGLAPNLPPPLEDREDVPQIPENSSVTAKVAMPIVDSDSDATIVQSLSTPAAVQPLIEEEAEETPPEGMELEEMPVRRWAKPAAMTAAAVAFAAIGVVVVQKFVPNLPIPFLSEGGSGDEIAEFESQPVASVPSRPVTREELKAPPPQEMTPEQKTATLKQMLAEKQPEKQLERPQEVLAATNQRPVPPAQPQIKINGKVVPAGAKATVAEVVPVRTDLQRPQFAVNTDAPVGSTVWLSVSARTGDVLKYPSFYKSTSVVRTMGQVPAFDLTSWKLPAGQYRVDAMVGDVRTYRNVFIGKRDQQFNADLEKHLKYLSYQQQEEKKALFRTTRDLEKLSKNLGENYFKMRADARKWRAFYLDWQKQVRRTKQGIVERTTPEKRNELTYPDEILAVKAASERMVEQARTLNDAIMSNTPARDVASPSQLAIVKEFARLRTLVGQLSVRK